MSQKDLGLVSPGHSASVLHPLAELSDVVVARLGSLRLREAQGHNSAAEPVGVVGGAQERVRGGSEAGDAVRAGGCHQEAEGLASPLAMVFLALVVVLGLHSFIYYLWELVWSRRLKDGGRWGLGGS